MVGHTKFYKSGDLLEVYEYEKAPSTKIKFKRKKRRQGKASTFVRYRRFDNRRRLARNFSRLVRSNIASENPPFLLTLTMSDVIGIKRSYQIFTVYISRLRQVFGVNWRYIAVPEFQKRGAVHFHCLIFDLNEICVKERSSRLLQNLWLRGFVDSVPTDGSGKLVTYISKYMSKAMQDDRLGGQKAYSASRNVMRSVSGSSRVILGYAPELWGIDLSTAVPLQQKEFPTQWLGKGSYKIYKLP